MMEKFKELKEDAKVLAEIVLRMRKMFHDANKLQKQGASISGDSSVFICRQVIKKDYVCTYVHAYDGVEELQFDELNSLVNPTVYKNGVFVISKNEGKLRFDSDSSICNNTTGPLNSTELESNAFHDNSNEISLIEHCVTVKEHNIVYCGNCELFAKDVNAGGATTFHGALGQLKKVTVSLKNAIPVSSVHGRYLSSIYIQCLKHLNIREAPALVVSCEPKRPMHILNFILFPECSEDVKNRLHIVTLFEEGNKKIKNLREDNIGQSSFLSTYDLFQIASDEKTDCDTSLRIEFHWSGNDYEATQPPPHSAKSVIQLQVTVGEDRSAANEVYLELKRLDTITHTQINSSAPMFSNSYSQQVVDDLKKFKACVSDIQFYNHEERTTSSTSEKTDDIETPLSQLLMENFWHKDIDFTDKLWTFIQQSAHVDSIFFILDDILTDIVNGSLQPAISPSNETKLAKYIRKLYVTTVDEARTDTEEKIMELLSNEQSIINLVREIGFEKLRKDYFNFFLSSELTSISNLEKICKTSCVNIVSLWKLHYCLEIVLTPTIYLNLPPDCQCTLLKAAIDYYSVNDIDVMSPKFCLSLLPFHESSRSIQNLCEDRRPIIWQHGVLHANKGGLNEAMITRIESKSTMSGGDETDVFHMKEVKRLLREETLVFTEHEMKRETICNGN